MFYSDRKRAQTEIYKLYIYKLQIKFIKKKIVCDVTFAKTSAFLLNLGKQYF